MANTPLLVPVFSSARAEAGLDLAAAVEPVLRSHRYVLGSEVQAFEAEFAHYLGVRHCVSVANGTDALELALRSVGAGSGDRVVTVANAGFYGSTAIHSIGGVPLYCEIDERSSTMACEALARLLSAGPRAVIVTHLYGQLADVERIVALCGAAGVPLIEDCAQAHGARSGMRRAGSFGTVACFSFYPTKNLGAAGDGGAIATSDEAIATAVRELRQYGWSRKYSVDRRGGRNSRLDEIQAAVLRAKLPRLDEWNAQRRAIASRYNDAFADLPLQCPASTGTDNVCHLYVVRSTSRDALRAHLQRDGIGSDVHYPVADHVQGAYMSSLGRGALPLTEAACDQCLTLPCFPGLTLEEQSRVIDSVRAFFGRGGS